MADDLKALVLRNGEVVTDWRKARKEGVRILEAIITLGRGLVMAWSLAN